MSKTSPAEARTAGFGAVALQVTSSTPPELVAIASSLARGFGARLIGVGARAFTVPGLLEPTAAYVGDAVVRALDELAQTELAAAERVFREGAKGADAEWRSAREPPAYALFRAARDADLVIAPAGRGSEVVAGAADLVMTTGRPVVVVPEALQPRAAERVVVAWKDTREARRAVADALPFLTAAREVLVLAVGAREDERELLLADAAAVAANLARRGVAARAEVVIAHGAAEEQIESAAAGLDADLIVAGAYGHGRFAEWAFGGVTRELLERPQRLLLLSH